MIKIKYKRILVCTLKKLEVSISKGHYKPKTFYSSGKVYYSENYKHMLRLGIGSVILDIQLKR